MDLDPLNDVRRRPSYETSELEKQHEQLNIKESDENLSVPRSVLSNSRPSNIPLSVLRLLQVYLNGFYNNRPERRNDNMKTHIDTPLFVNMIGYLKELTDLMTQAEKIRDSGFTTRLVSHLILTHSPNPSNFKHTSQSSTCTLFIGNSTTVGW